jgi:uncharacterized protein
VSAIQGLFRYSVKSLRGVALHSATLLTQGIAGDRQWMVVDQRGRFLTQREYPRLATITAIAHLDGLTLEHDHHGACTVAQPIAGRDRFVQVWNDTLTAKDADDEASQWLSAILGVSARLVWFDDRQPRLCSQTYTHGTGAHTRFADGYPVLITNAASLVELNTRMHRPITMDRFRPNIVIDGVDAWEEDHIETLTIGAVALRLVKPCVRCITTTTDQHTGERINDEPLNTLARYRNNPDLGGVTFGVNAIVVQGGDIRVGDAISFAHRF